ncbi:MAG: DUF115 domain-containing protein [Helicobacteraceae bacterium]|jgi:hypothetical protein|nr:DUF115 domain-containing protein [Helicobacteraceae bacterium]
MERNYRKNLDALYGKNRELWERLRLVEGNTRYEVFAGRDPIDINILESASRLTLYTEPIADTENKINEFHKYLKYPFLCLFGIGNGFFIKALLGRKALEHLIIIEPEIEIIYIALHINDFSKEINSLRLIVLHADDLTSDLAMRICKMDKIVVYLKLYNLELTTEYYSKYYSVITKVNKIMVEAIYQSIVMHGNDLNDALTGLDNFLENADDMIASIPFIDFRSQEYSQTAVIVATGPSLTKQLKTLKEIEEFVTIISVDASLPILERHDITPDIVTSLERIELSAEFYEKTSEAFHKKIGCFAISALAHQRVIKAIKGQKSLILRPFGYMQVFELHRFGYAGIGMSAANMAYEIAYITGHKNTLLIGQDLAYSSDGVSTHASGHIFGEKDEGFLKNNKAENDLYLPSWDNSGTVRSNATWQMFRNFYIQNITDAKERMTTYNCTEGGCYIDGAIHKPFITVINTLIDRTKPKKHLAFAPIDEVMATHDRKKIKSVINAMIKEADKTIDALSALLKDVTKIALALEKITLAEQLKTADFKAIEKLNIRIDRFKTRLNDPLFAKYFWESLRAIVINQELNIAKIVVQIASTIEEKNRISLEFLFAHRMWLFTVLGAISAQKEILLKYA